MAANEAVSRVWKPDDVWRRYIESQLRRYGMPSSRTRGVGMTPSELVRVLQPTLADIATAT